MKNLLYAFMVMFLGLFAIPDNTEAQFESEDEVEMISAIVQSDAEESGVEASIVLPQLYAYRDVLDIFSCGTETGYAQNNYSFTTSNQIAGSAIHDHHYSKLGYSKASRW